MSATGQVAVDVLLHPEERLAALRADVLAGLTATPKALPAKWFYDERGSALFEEITRLPEYYLTGCERAILVERAAEIAAAAPAETLVELGSGSSEKTRLLLDAMTQAGALRRYVPFDVSEEALRASVTRLHATYPTLELHGVVGDFDHHLDRLPTAGRRLVAFLGSSIGNLVGEERTRFLRALRASFAAGDWFLLGTDLVKDVARLEAAYDDPGGVTAEFNRNVLRVIDNAFGADFRPERFGHEAPFDPVHEWMDIGLRSLEQQTVHVRGLGLTVRFAAGERMRTELSAKFRRELLEVELAAAGFVPLRWWTDAGGDFALSLWEAA